MLIVRSLMTLESEAGAIEQAAQRVGHAQLAIHRLRVGMPCTAS